MCDCEVVEGRHLRLSLATTQPVDGARLISGYGAVRLRGGQLAGSSVVRAPILYIGNQSPVRSRSGLGPAYATRGPGEKLSGFCRLAVS